MDDLQDIMRTLGLSKRPKLAPRGDLLTQLTERAKVNEPKAVEVGDKKFPLVIHSSEVDRKHKLVGTDCQITKYASERLSKHRGHIATVTGVIVRVGQIAGYEVRMGGKTFLTTKKDVAVFGQRRIAEDVFLDSRDTMEIRKALRHWLGQRDYMGTEWAGIEWLCFALARRAKSVAVESAGWYKYKSSMRSDQDGKDWRYVCTETPSLVSVNCHSLLHDDVWTLATTVFDTHNSIDRSKLPKAITHEDAWTRSMLWAIRTAEILGAQGYDYSRAITDMRKRLKQVASLQETKRRAMADVSRALHEYFGDKPNHPRDDMTIVLAGWGVPTGSIGRWIVHYDDTPFSEIHISPTAFNAERDKKMPPLRSKLRPGESLNYRYVDYVVLHEVMHSALHEDCPRCGPTGHSGRFKELAKIVGLPLKLAD